MVGLRLQIPVNLSMPILRRPKSSTCGFERGFRRVKRVLRLLGRRSGPGSSRVRPVPST